MYKQSECERKLIQIFKAFVERALLPQIKKSQGSLMEWNKFSSLLLADPLNYNDLQYYVSSFAPLPTPDNDKSLQLNRKSEVVDTQNKAFNVNSTFGGDKNKITMAINEAEAAKQTKDDSLRQRSNTSNALIKNLQKLLQSLEQNQTVIESYRGKQPTTPTRPVRDTSSNPKQNQQKTHSFTYIPVQQQQQQPYSISQSQSMPVGYLTNPHVQMNPSMAPFQKGYY